MFWSESIKALITALGIGLMIGVIRERRSHADAAKAGTRTHALLALLGALTWTMGLIPFTATLLIVGAYGFASYLKTADKDPGLTGEVTIVLTFILAAMANVNIALAAGLAVLVAILLQAKKPIHKLSRDLISERELSEALLVLASALIVMPLLPGQAIDPWGVIELNNIWRIVVLIMAMGMFGHIARRALGAKLGLPVAGFFSGFASSTAAIASLGHKVKQDSNLLYTAAASALLSNLSSLLLFTSVIGAISPDLLKLSALPLGAAMIALFAVAISILIFHKPKNEIINQNSGQSFKLSHALIIAIAISAVSLISFWMNNLLGSAGVLITSALVALAEIHAAAASLGQLASTNGISMETAEWGVIAVLAASSISKIFLSFLSGGKNYGKIVSSGLILMMVVLILTLIFV